MTKHTPAPWKTRECTKCHVWELKGPKNEEILCGHYVGDDIDGDYYGAISDEANARLISAAPELLEALKRANAVLAELTFSDWIPKKDAPSIDIRQRINASHVIASSAISKAEGAV